MILEWLQNGDLTSQSCSYFVFTRSAPVGGMMLHGRILDWDKIEFMLKLPTLIVRHPEGRIPYVVVGDGTNDCAAAFEMTATHLSVR